MLKMYLYTTMKFLGQGFQKLEHEQDRQTHRQTDAQTDRRTDRQTRIREWWFTSTYLLKLKLFMRCATNKTWFELNCAEKIW